MDQFEKPRIGIRPIIDGRVGGVREVIEEQTFRMANMVAALLTDTVRYRDGSPLECVVADKGIGGAKEAALAEEKFRGANVQASISVTPCWAYGSETIDLVPDRPKAIWGFNGSERSGAVYLAAALAAHNQLGLPAFGIYGHDVQDRSDTYIPEDVQQKLIQFARCALAVAEMKGKSYLSIGSVCMGIAGSMVNEDFFRSYLGMRSESVDMSEISRRIELGIFDEEEYEKGLGWVKTHCREGVDAYSGLPPMSRGQKDKVWETAVKMTLIMRDLMVGNPKLAQMGFPEEANGHNAIAGGFQGQRNWNDFRPNGDFPEAILCSSFDWNGLREPYVFATENDSLNGVSMLFAHLLTNTAQSFADVRTYWSPEAVKRFTGYTLTGAAENGVIHLKNSGSIALDACGEQQKDGKPAMKPFWEITEEEMNRCLNATSWHSAHQGYFRGGGFSSKIITKGNMPVTMLRVNIVRGLGPVLQLAEGYTVDLPPEVHETLDNRTDPTWPSTWFVPNLTGRGAFRDVYSVMNGWGANHAAFCYGHIGSDLITLASMLRIPVAMHNVSDEQIFRPSAWSLFGEGDPVGSDFRACAGYGSLY